MLDAAEWSASRACASMATIRVASIASKSSSRFSAQTASKAFFARAEMASGVSAAVLGSEEQRSAKIARELGERVSA
jgi:hypothetical protein